MLACSFAWFAASWPVSLYTGILHIDMCHGQQLLMRVVASFSNLETLNEWPTKSGPQGTDDHPDPAPATIDQGNQTGAGLLWVPS